MVVWVAGFGGIIMERVKQLFHEFYTDVAQLFLKGGAGVAGSFAAMSINDIVGLIVGILTGVYMTLQIEAAWRKRKEAIRRQREAR